MFFSVKTTMKIGDKIYKPCICYKVTKDLQLTIDKLVAEGKAYEYETEVFFQNGKVLEKKTVVKEDLTTKNGKKAEKKAVVKESLTTEKGKKAKKEATPAVAEAETVAEETEGF